MCLSRQEDEDVEWKFARAALYMDYIMTGRVLPSPLNLVEVPRDILLYTLTSIRRLRVAGHKGSNSGNNNSNGAHNGAQTRRNQPTGAAANFKIEDRLSRVCSIG